MMMTKVLKWVNNNCELLFYYIYLQSEYQRSNRIVYRLYS